MRQGLSAFAALAASGAALLAACATPYVEPTAGQLARISIPATKRAWIGANRYAQIALHDAKTGCGEPKGFDTEPDAPIVVNLNADRVYSVRMVYLEGERTCTADAMFTAAAGKRYAAEFEGDARTCSVSVLDVTEGFRTPVRTVRPRVDFVSSLLCDPAR
jgi:hypothetical protein